MVNKVIIVGRLGRDPDVKRTERDGKAVAKFAVATDESWTDRSGERQKRTEWHNIVAWGKLAEICEQFLTKGQLVYVEGRIQSREYEGRDGEKKRVTEIIANTVRMLGNKKQDASGGR